MEKGNQMLYSEFILKYVPPAGNTNIVKTIFSIVLGWVKISHTNTNGTITQIALTEAVVPENLVALMDKISDPEFFAAFSTQVDSIAGGLLAQIAAMQTQITAVTTPTTSASK